MVYTADDWQAQLEEVLALQSIYAENFRWAWAVQLASFLLSNMAVHMCMACCMRGLAAGACVHTHTCMHGVAPVMQEQHWLTM